MDLRDFSEQRAYKRCLIRLQSERYEDGRWIPPRCSIMYPTREGNVGAHKITFEKTANTLELADATAFQLAKNWIDRNEDDF